MGIAWLGIGLGIGLTCIGGGYGIGRLAGSAMDGIARQPEATGNIRGTAIILAALIEGFVFFALIICLLANFAAQGVADKEAEVKKSAVTAHAK